MSKDRENTPRANILMGSMRSIGYTFESAIADVIDNSISAHCSNVYLLFPENPLEELAVGILDDGCGMSDAHLFEAMRYGSSSSEDQREMDDLGRFGLGMKSASMSMCRKLTVASKLNDIIHAYTWDYGYIKQKEAWITEEHTKSEIQDLPYIDRLKSQKQGTLVIWRDFDVISKSSNGQVYEALNEHKQSVNEAVSLIFHRFLNSKNKLHINIFINNAKVSGLDPFLEDNPKTTRKKEVSIATNDSNGIERQVKVRAFILPYASDLKNKDRQLVGGVESLKSKQGFYLYRNHRLIVWGTWFGMRPRSELTKNARIRVDIPNSLDDIFKIDVKKQTAYIPRYIQNQLKRLINDALETSISKQTFRGRKQDVNDIDYIWNRMEARNNTFYYQINRNSEIYKLVREHLNSEGVTYLDILLKEIEKNLPIQQIYIDKSNESLCDNEIDDKKTRLKDVLNLAINVVENVKGLHTQSVAETINTLMKSEPFCHYKEIEDELKKYYKNEIEQ